MKLVIFDFDGVLVDTLMMNYEITSEVNKGISMDSYRSLFNGNIFDSFNEGSKFNKHPNFYELYEERTRELKVPDALQDLLKNLGKKYNLAVVSATPSNLIEKILKQADSFDYFSSILGGDVHKSKVVKNKMLLEKYKVSPEDTVYITDTVGDILEARECEIKSIAVTWGFHEEKSLRDANPEKIVNTPEELAGAIEELL